MNRRYRLSEAEEGGRRGGGGREEEEWRRGGGCRKEGGGRELGSQPLRPSNSMTLETRCI